MTLAVSGDTLTFSTPFSALQLPLQAPEVFPVATPLGHLEPRTPGQAMHE